eukprot:1328996-Rhodomonas_salina.1
MGFGLDLGFGAYGFGMRGWETHLWGARSGSQEASMAVQLRMKSFVVKVSSSNTTEGFLLLKSTLEGWIATSCDEADTM